MKAVGIARTETTSIVAAKTKTEAGGMIESTTTCAPVVTNATEIGTGANIIVAAKIVSDMDTVVETRTGRDEYMKN
jgi:hypothetical protein